MEWLGLITLLSNVVIPPVFNLIKGWVSGGKADTPEQTMSNLATTKPETLPSYVQALSSYLSAQTSFFNRDISGVPSKWVIDLRAAIRPGAVIFSFLILGLNVFSFIKVDVPVVLTCQTVIGNWIGTKMEIHP